MIRRPPRSPLDRSSAASDVYKRQSIALAAEATGLSPVLLAAANICIYTSANPAYVGIIGRTYRLDINAEGKTLSAVSTIPDPVALDSVWFQLALQTSGDDSLCLLYTSDAADERSSVDLGGRRIIKKKNNKRISRQSETRRLINTINSRKTKKK